jgi:hypothetical protein
MNPIPWTGIVLSFSLITDDLILSSTDQNVFCIVNCKEDYDHLKLACKPIFSENKHIIRKIKYLPSCGFYEPYTMDRNNYIEIHPTQAQVAKIFISPPIKISK